MTAQTLEKQLVEFPVAFFVEKFSHELTTAIDQYGFKGAVFGASGGIDSLLQQPSVSKPNKEEINGL